MPSSPLTLFLALVLGLAALARGACNGNDALCARRYSNVTFVGSHDSAFVGILPSDNQAVSVADQLALGVRFLQAQTHNKDGTIEMCHTSCLELDAGSLQDYLAPVKTFLDANQDEVVTLLLTNGDAISVADYKTAFEAAGLEKYVFSPNGTLALDQWPTLQTMIDDGTRLVVWMGKWPIKLKAHREAPTIPKPLTSCPDYNANTSLVPYILDEFSYFYETRYNETDSSFPDCSIDRPAEASASGRMGLVNHMLHVQIPLVDIQIPDESAADTTNSVASIEAQTGLCIGLYGVTPNVVLVSPVARERSASSGVHELIKWRLCSWTTSTRARQWLPRLRLTDCRARQRSPRIVAGQFRTNKQVFPLLCSTERVAL